MNLIVFAFLSGILGAMIGGTASFVVTGIVGIFTILLSSLQVDISLINDQVLHYSRRNLYEMFNLFSRNFKRI